MQVEIPSGFRRYNRQENSDDEAYALVVDSSGNVYVTGYSYGLGTNNDYANNKYNVNGDTVWVHQYNGSGNSDDKATALAVNGSGNVYSRVIVTHQAVVKTSQQSTMVEWRYCFGFRQYNDREKNLMMGQLLFAV